MNQPECPSCALMLPGGGARAAYQVGALEAIMEMRGEPANPFPIITGTSAGAINAGVLASHAGRFMHGLSRLEYFWSNMACHQIYRTDLGAVLKSGFCWLSTLLTGGRGPFKPRSLLDNAPLRRLLESEFKSDGIAEAIAAGALHALAVTASGYTTSAAISFYQGTDDIVPWLRPRRLGRPAQIGVAHLMASASLPLLFPAECIGYEYFGDGGLRQTAPLSPAIHLGARKLLIIGTRDEHPDPEPKAADYPGLGEIGAHMLDIIFMDNLQADLARLNRINHTLSLLPVDKAVETPLKPIRVLLLRPTRDLRALSAAHAHRMPSTVRYLLSSIGAWGAGTRMPSYLLFEKPFCEALLQMGREDAYARRDEIMRFFDA